MSIQSFIDSSGFRQKTPGHISGSFPVRSILGLFFGLTLINPMAARLSQYEEEELLFLKEEEKLARDVYTTLGLLWDVRVFQNIARSEQVHMDQVDSLLATFGLPDPALPEVGRFQNPILQHLFDRLTTEGGLSLRTALGVGEFIEVIDIDDLEDLISSSTEPSIIAVADRLKSGSLNHLAAFRRQLDLLGDPFPDPDPDTDLVNLSARGILGDGEEALIGGFVIEGSGTMDILMTVRGPSLADYGVGDPATDPAMTLFQGDVRLAANDDWTESASDALQARAEQIGIMPSESAILINLPSGAYTFVSQNHGGGSIGLVEVYGRAEDGAEAFLANLSVRGRTEPGEGRLIAGFVVEGVDSRPVIVRALGPTLADFGVQSVVGDPVLHIFRENLPVRTVGDWIHEGVLGVVGVEAWPGSILEPADVLSQGPGTVTVHGVDEMDSAGIIMIDLNLPEP